MNTVENIKIMVRIAELYYNNNLTQQQIAQELNLSRSKVFRYLQESVNSGIVQISINNPFKSSSQLEDQLKARFSLTDIIIVPSPAEYAQTEALKTVAAAAAGYLSRVLTDGAILGVEWGYTAYCISQSLVPSTVKDIILVQLLGCSYQSQYNTDKVVIEFARKLNTVPFTLPFPVVVESTVLMEALRKESRVIQTYSLYDRLDVALLTVGWMGTDSTNYLEGFVTKEEIKRLSRMGAVADICGRYFDIHGNICDPELYNRAVSIDFERIKKTRLPVLVANGDKKVQGIIGALNGGLCKVLITDEHTANLVAEQIG